MKTLIGCWLILCSVLANASDTAMTINVDLATSQFTVKLPGNPTTGFQWTVKEYDKTILNLTDSQYLPPQTKLVGAGGNMIFTFELVKGKKYPQSTQMVFNYSRSWEPESETLKQVTVNFTDSLENK